MIGYLVEELATSRHPLTSHCQADPRSPTQSPVLPPAEAAKWRSTWHPRSSSYASSNPAAIPAYQTLVLRLSMAATCSRNLFLAAMPKKIGAAATSLPSKPLQQSFWPSPGHSHDMRLLAPLHEAAVASVCRSRSSSRAGF
ncbi:hypothetical protein PF005_g12147 [Phytophthora fragariae]|uniref:Uncharacterized protein n=1 Tax=Phytophthora fragariae TaxID=53985 RepID=A0A6A3XZY2_9STRA|nr:hypothetical protein PF009_g26555 [Phytophthora fragariae]KAE8973799.1 hypothetical protein PF011_g25111 [Phytophthora fragariae]KAE9070900.1 hypothetical protein PF007_g26760 [Phytophthora fragariae]KAE9072735.1 hypothetical protein PF010_g25363 [Phytophthora fragariae]KAE9143805.1 hypothetical protein PF006_g11207 [Phytophthora fragariae]